MTASGPRDVRGSPAERHNWALLAAVSVVSFGGAIVYGVAGDRSAAIPVYFVAASVAVGAFSYAWFRRYPPALRAPGWCYIAVVLALEIGAYLGGSIDDSRAVGAWIAVGLAFVAYGVLERSALISLTGGLAALLAVAGLWSGAPALGLLLELGTGSVFGLAAWRLRGAPGDP